MTTLPAKYPLCTDCEWCRRPPGPQLVGAPGGQAFELLCFAQIPDPVSGGPPPPVVKAAQQRMSLCGLDGRYFQPRVPRK